MRVVIAEDAVLLREGLARLLDEGGFEVVDASPTARRCCAPSSEHQPDVCVVDVRMPPTFTDEGVRAALVIRKQWPGRVAADALPVRRGALRRRPARRRQPRRSATCSRTASPTSREFLEALRRVAAGGTALDPEVVTQLLVRSRPQGPARAALPARARGARADGRGPHQQPDRRGARRHRGRRREARHEHLPQARPAARRPGAPPGAGRAALPGARSQDDRAWPTRRRAADRRRARPAVLRDRRRAGRGLDDRRRRALDRTR